MRWFRSAESGLALILALILLTRATSADQTNPLVRSLPFPFRHVVSFASDIDLQSPAHGAAIHRVINEEIGLPFSDSLWVHGGGENSSLFSGTSTLNQKATGVEGLPTYALLMRRWHRGDFDHFHGWSEDGALQIRNNLAPAALLRQKVTRIALPPISPVLQASKIRDMRLYFDAPPPVDLMVSVVASDGAATLFNVGEVLEGLKVQAFPSEIGYIVGISERAESKATLLDVRFTHAVRIDLIAPSCALGCAVNLTRVERDDFSRVTAASQLTFLELANIRPSLYTTHGGATLAAGFGGRTPIAQSPRTASPIFDDPNVMNLAETLADAPERHAYISDFLSGLGVVGVTPFSGPYARYHNASKQIPFISRSVDFNRFYNVARSQIGTPLNMLSRNLFTDSLLKGFPEASAGTASEVYCGLVCWWSQGDGIAQELFVSEYMQNRMEQVEHFWYTHFGSGGSSFKHDNEFPLTPQVSASLQRLAKRAFNFDGSAAGAQVWTPPATVWLRYQILMTGIAEHVAVSPLGEVSISSWIDSITSKRVPDLEAGSRDLHGLTIHVPAGVNPTVVVDGHRLHTYTINPPDETGLPSISIVDDHTPTVLLDNVPLRRRGSLNVQAGSFEDVHGHPDERFASLTADATGRALVEWQPYDLRLYHTSHLRFSFRQRMASGSSSARGMLRLTFVMEDGGTVSAAFEGAPRLPLASEWRFPRPPADREWRHITLALDTLTWPASVTELLSPRRPPLLLGKVVALLVSLDGADPGDTVDVAQLAALRPDGTGVSPSGTLLVAGRVTDADGAPQAGMEVRYENDDRDVVSTATDADGIYMFPLVTRGQRLHVYAVREWQTCGAAAGDLLEIQKNDAEIDIDWGHCR